MKKFLAWMLILASGFGQTVQAEVTSLEFRQATERHVDRLCEAMEITYLRFQSHFPTLNTELIEFMCRFHDMPKLMNLENLKAYGYFPDESVSDALSRIEGLELRDPNNGLSSAEVEYSRSVIAEMNKIENQLKESGWEQAFFIFEVDVDLAKKEFELIEKLVDVYDVKIFRTDIGLGGGPGDAAKFFENRGELTDLGREILTFLENYYTRLFLVNCNRNFFVH